MNVIDTRSIERFVRGTLGCRCPDEVFASIQISPDAEAGTRFLRLLIGDRLLIYVLRTGGGSPAPGLVWTLTRRGRAERDAGGHNRFRLVLAADEEVDDAAVDAFTSATQGDDKAHLHVTSPDELPAALLGT